jgi:hypothetical protein
VSVQRRQQRARGAEKGGDVIRVTEGQRHAGRYSDFCPGDAPVQAVIEHVGHSNTQLRRLAQRVKFAGLPRGRVDFAVDLD